MADVKCPAKDRMRPMDECLSCEHLRNEDDTSTIWCRYLIGKMQERQKDIRTYYAQINYKTKLADRLYKTGKPYAADSVMKEIEKMRKELREYEKQNPSFDTETKAAI